MGRARLPEHPSRDIEGPDDVADMVRCFYADVAQDDLLGPMFNDVARVDWSDHIPRLTAFWNRALFGINGYNGNPFRAHREVHDRRPFEARHFLRWLELFEETIDLRWVGPNAEQVKKRARDIARAQRRQLIERPEVAAPNGGLPETRRELLLG